MSAFGHTVLHTITHNLTKLALLRNVFMFQSTFDSFEI